MNSFKEVILRTADKNSANCEPLSLKQGFLVQDKIKKHYFFIIYECFKYFLATDNNWTNGK